MKEKALVENEISNESQRIAESILIDIDLSEEKRNILQSRFVKALEKSWLDGFNDYKTYLDIKRMMGNNG